MFDTPQEILNQVNGDTKITSEYFDMDRNEFVSKDELLKRFSNPLDYYTKIHAFDSDSNEHRLLWVYSKTRFASFNALLDIRIIRGLD